jgi:FkbM family methyltransferase
MFRNLREKIKRAPFIGPVLHAAYLRIFYNEGGILEISGGTLRGKKWIRFMRTHNDEYVRGDYEPGVQAALRLYLKPGMTFFDIGANAGFFSLLGATIVGSSGKVFAFEPHPKTSSQLRQQIAINGMANINIVMAAVSSEVGVAKLSDDTVSVMASLAGAASASSTISVKTTTLDHELNFLPAPNVIKIDAEGAEEDILIGSATVLRQCKPVIIFECWAESRQNLFNIFDSNGYSIRDLPRTPNFQGDVLSHAEFLAAPDLNYIATPVKP